MRYTQLVHCELYIIIDILLLLLISIHIGSCVAAGYKSCCVQTDDDSCHGHPETCFCDASCHNFGDCCADINDIGCSAMQGSCLAAGHTSCCLSEDPKCTGEPGNCMCDQACAKRGDCCSDISSLTNCEVHDSKYF